MSIFLVVLQCAYGNTARRRQQLRVRRLWLRGLWASHTGRRLRDMLPMGCEVVPINASPRIGSSVSALFPPDPLYVARCWELVLPDVTVACGKVAQQACREAGVPFIGVPHPAWRLLSNEAVADVRAMLEGYV